MSDNELTKTKIFKFQETVRLNVEEYTANDIFGRRYRLQIVDKNNNEVLFANGIKEVYFDVPSLYLNEQRLRERIQLLEEIIEKFLNRLDVKVTGNNGNDI